MLRSVKDLHGCNVRAPTAKSAASIRSISTTKHGHPLSRNRETGNWLHDRQVLRAAKPVTLRISALHACRRTSQVAIPHALTRLTFHARRQTVTIEGGKNSPEYAYQLARTATCIFGCIRVDCFEEVDEDR